MTVPLSKTISQFQREYKTYVDVETRNRLNNTSKPHKVVQKKGAHLLFMDLHSNINYSIQTKASNFQHHTHVNSDLAENPFNLLTEWSSMGFSDDELSMSADTWSMEAYEWVLKYNKEIFDDLKLDEVPTFQHKSVLEPYRTHNVVQYAELDRSDDEVMNKFAKSYCQLRQKWSTFVHNVLCNRNKVSPNNTTMFATVTRTLRLSNNGYPLTLTASLKYVPTYMVNSSRISGQLNEMLSADLSKQLSDGSLNSTFESFYGQLLGLK